MYITDARGLVVVGSVIHDNTAITRGGALYMHQSGELRIVGSFVLGNRAATGAGVFVSSDSKLTLVRWRCGFGVVHDLTLTC